MNKNDDVPFHARHEDDLLTLEEVAEILMTSPNTVRWHRRTTPTSTTASVVASRPGTSRASSPPTTRRLTTTSFSHADYAKPLPVSSREPAAGSSLRISESPAMQWSSRLPSTSLRSNGKQWRPYSHTTWG